MKLKEIMQQDIFVVVGNTTNEEKYAYKIKKGLTENGYEVYSVGKELQSINDVDTDIDIIVMCINPVAGLEFLKEYKKKCKCVVLQPGAESLEIKQYLEDKKQKYVEGCVLVGLRMYEKHKQ